MNQADINLKDLYQKYIIKKMSCNSIAKEYHCSILTVIRCIRKQEWPFRAIHRRCDHDEVVQLYQQGKSTSDIAKQLKMAHITIAGILKNAGYQLKRDNSIYDSRIYDLYFNQKRSYTQVSKELSLPIASIQERFKINKWTARVRSVGVSLTHRDFDDQYVIDLYSKYLSTPAVAALIGLSHTAVDAILIKHNIARIGNLKPCKNGGENVISSWLKEWSIDHIMQWNKWDISKITNRWHHIDVYVPKYKLFIEFYGDSYHKDTGERDLQKKEDFLVAYPDHKWIVIREGDIKNKSICAVTKENLRHQFLTEPLSIGDLVFNQCEDKAYAMRFLDIFHNRKRTEINKYIYTISLNKIIVGVAAFNVPQQAGSGYDYEFTRLALCSGLPKNTASWFIQRCVDQFIPGSHLVTYIDSEHQGSAFKGCNWSPIGYTKLKYAYYFINLVGDRLNRRKVWNLAKKAGQTVSAYAQLNNLKKISEPPKQIFYFKS